MDCKSLAPAMDLSTPAQHLRDYPPRCKDKRDFKWLSSLFATLFGYKSQLMACEHRNLPPEDVLRAFSLTGNPIVLAGGQGESFILDDIVLKPTRNVAETEWLSIVQKQLAQIASPEYRIAEPIATTDSDPPCYVANGWTVTRFILGEGSRRIRIDEILAASRAMHGDLKDIVRARPDFIRLKPDRWSCADRVAWEEVSLENTPDVDIEIYKTLSPWLDRLYRLREPLDQHSIQNQLVHGDLSGGGNVLFAPAGETDQMSPAIIDFSPYWRPVEYAEAIVVADGLIWHHAGEEMVRILGVNQFRLQMLVRAVIFRVVTFAIQPDAAFVQANMHKMDGQAAVLLLERLCKTDAESRP